MEPSSIPSPDPPPSLSYLQDIADLAQHDYEECLSAVQAFFLDLTTSIKSDPDITPEERQARTAPLEQRTIRSKQMADILFASVSAELQAAIEICRNQASNPSSKSSNKELVHYSNTGASLLSEYVPAMFDPTDIVFIQEESQDIDLRFHFSNVGEFLKRCCDVAVALAEVKAIREMEADSIEDGMQIHLRLVEFSESSVFDDLRDVVFLRKQTNERTNLLRTDIRNQISFLKFKFPEMRRQNIDGKNGFIINAEPGTCSVIACGYLHYISGSTSVSSGDLRTALEEYQKAIDITPTCYMVPYYLAIKGNVARDFEQHGEARACFDRATKKIKALARDIDISSDTFSPEEDRLIARTALQFITYKYTKIIVKSRQAQALSSAQRYEESEDALSKIVRKIKEERRRDPTTPFLADEEKLNLMHLAHIQAHKRNTTAARKTLAEAEQVVSDSNMPFFDSYQATYISVIRASVNSLLNEIEVSDKIMKSTLSEINQKPELFFGQLMVNDQLGTNAMVEGRYAESEHYLLQALKATEGKASGVYKGILHANLMTLYIEWGEREDQAFYHSSAALQVFRAHGREEIFVTEILTFHGLMLLRLGDISQAESTLLQCLEKLQPLGAESISSGYIQIALSEVYIMKGDFEEARKQLAVAKDVVFQHKDDQTELRVCYSSAFARLALSTLSRIDEAEYFLEKSILMRKATKPWNSGLLQLYFLLGMLQSQKGDQKCKDAFAAAISGSETASLVRTLGLSYWGLANFLIDTEGNIAAAQECLIVGLQKTSQLPRQDLTISSLLKLQLVDVYRKMEQNEAAADILRDISMLTSESLVTELSLGIEIQKNNGFALIRHDRAAIAGFKQLLKYLLLHENCEKNAKFTEIVYRRLIDCYNRERLSEESQHCAHKAEIIRLSERWKRELHLNWDYLESEDLTIPLRLI